MATDYNPFDSELPRVQIPIGADRAGLTIDGDFMSLFELPAAAREAYIEYAENGGSTRIYQCGRCGYLTDSDAFKASTYNRAYECGGCGARLKGTTQHKGSGDYRQVFGPYVDADDEVHPGDVVPDGKCDGDHGPIIVEEAGRFGTAEVDEEAVACPDCVPNHPSHLGKLRNRADVISQSEMMQRVAEAVRDFREA